MNRAGLPIAILLLAVAATMALPTSGSAPSASPYAPADLTRTDRARPLSTDVPILLVPGWSDTGRDLAALRIRLVTWGWDPDRVRTVTFEEPAGSNRDHALELAAAVEEMIVTTGATQVDIVAHSMGGLATRWYLRGSSPAPVRRVVFIASPHRGTLAAHLAWGGGREEMMPESPFLDTLNMERPAPVSVDAITIRTRVETHILPGVSATLPGVPDHEVCCPTHAGLLHDDEVFDIVRRFLEER